MKTEAMNPTKQINMLVLYNFVTSTYQPKKPAPIKPAIIMIAPKNPLSLYTNHIELYIKMIRTSLKPNGFIKRSTIVAKQL